MSQYPVLVRKYYIENDNGASLWCSKYLTPDRADELYNAFSDNTFPLIKNPKVKVYGKECICHRRVGFFSDASAGYPFAGQIAKSLPLNSHPSLPPLLDEINTVLHTKFNGILINHYLDGSDYIGKHRDDERTLYNGVVAAISLGESRNFRVRRYCSDEIVANIPTEHGQLLVMDGTFQKEFTHEIPVQKRVEGGRISLTFRYHQM